MNDHRFLRKEGEHEEKGLLNAETNPSEGAELLVKMKRISHLIEDVSLITNLFGLPYLKIFTYLLLYREL
jgi:hypothetical protein